MRKKKHAEHVNHERWLVSYADFITLLFAFFVVMFAVSQVDTGKVGRFTQSFAEANGIVLGGGVGAGLSPGAEETKAAPKPGIGNTHEDLTQGPGGPCVTPSKTRSKEATCSLALSIVRRRNELVLRLSDDILFASGNDILKDRAQKALLAISEALRDLAVDVRVEGHTDDVPIKTARFRSNWDLSTARATKPSSPSWPGPGHIAPERLAAAGYGEFSPSPRRIRRRRVARKTAASISS